MFTVIEIICQLFKWQNIVNCKNTFKINVNVRNVAKIIRN